MSNLDWVDASRLRMSSFRYSKINVSVPQVESMAAGGHINLSTTIGVELREDKLIVVPQMRATIMPSRSEDDVEDESAGAARVEIIAVVGYDIPDDQEITGSEIEDLQPKQIEMFLHMLEPMLMLKLKSLLSDAGARGVSIPPHVYVPDSAEPADDMNG